MKKTLDAIRRLWYTGGNGIHSPFAYQLVTQVICCPGAYYADEWLYPMRDRLLHPRRTAVRKLLFRLANHWQPREVCGPEVFHPYLHAGCRAARLVTQPGPFVTLWGGEGRMVVVTDLGRHQAEWDQLKREPDVRVTFDLRDVGIAVCVARLNKQHYIINW